MALHPPGEIACYQDLPVPTRAQLGDCSVMSAPTEDELEDFIKDGPAGWLFGLFVRLLICWSVSCPVIFWPVALGSHPAALLAPKETLLAKRLECLCSLHSIPALGLFQDYEGMKLK